MIIVVCGVLGRFQLAHLISQEYCGIWAWVLCIFWIVVGCKGGGGCWLDCG